MKKSDLTKFPREFKKKRLQSIDWDFVVIVIVTLFLHILFVLIVITHLPSVLQPDNYTQIQEQYASILLDRDSFGERMISSAGTMPSASDLIGGSRGGGGEGGVGIPAEGGGGGADFSGAAGSGGSAESRLPTMGERSARRDGAGSGRGRSLQDVTNDVGRVGFLGILSSGSGFVSPDYVDGINTYGDAANTRLGYVLSSLDGGKIGRGRGGPGSGSGGGTGPAGGRVLRGTRRERHALTIDELIGNVSPTGKVAFKDIKRANESFEKVAHTEEIKPLVPVTPEEREYLRRKPEDVQAIINKHRMVITDCYKRLLKSNPSLKGKVEVRFAINPEGQVSWAEMITTTIQNEHLINCMIARIKNWNDFGFSDPTAPDEVYRQVFTFGY
ncbi:AgmX/PglI C-terminal domain-containing protein [candidate division KSB1 bacterium]|nr:AgmX/PglI C-terminal domain-containing protein [candidate division KSB1 bacterium]